MKGKITIVRLTILILGLSLSGIVGLHGQWLEAYNYRMKITIDETLIPGTEALNDFPMLFSYTDTILKSLAFGGAVSFPDGRDIRFTGPDSLSLLEYEFEYYDPVTGTLVAWVRIPSLSATVNTELFLYVGDPAGSPGWNGPEVWSNQYSAVWHMNNDPSATAPQITDATSFLNHGTTGGTMTIDDQVQGKISGGIDFDGVDDYAIMPVSGFNTDSGSIEMWINLDSISLIESDYFFAHRQEDPITDRAYLRVWDTGAWGTGMGDTYDLVRGSTLDTATWHHLAITWDGDEVTGYLDGAQDFGPQSYSALDTVREIFIMTWMPSSESADGTLDELRVSSVPRDSGWIVASYQNQNQPGLFYLVNSLEKYENPCDATTLNITETCEFSIYTNIGAGISGLPDPGCGAYMGGELWFKVTVPPSGSFEIQTDTETEQQYPFNNGWMYRLAMALYEGTCNDLTLIGCYENNSIYHPRMAGVSLSGRTPGEDIWVRIWENTNNDIGKFKICVSEPSIQTYNVFGVGGYCQGDTGVSIFLSGSTPGIDYTLILNYTIRLDTIQGDGGPLTWSPVQLEGIYRIMGEVPGVGPELLMNDSVEVIVYDIPLLSFQADSITCFEENDGSIIPSITGGAEPYAFLWSGPGGFSSTEPNLNDLAPGSYALTVTDDNLCVNSGQDIVISQPELLVTSIEQVNHLTGYEANDGAILVSVIGGTPPYAFSWTGTNHYESVEQNALDLTLGNYDVRLTDAQLCQDSILKIGIVLENSSPVVFIPEGFSPNGDGYNDFFVILGIEKYPGTELLIVNGQGGTLYHSSDYRNDWDGSPEQGAVLGSTLQEGTYYYVLRFEEGSVKKGFIYLNRE